MRIDAFNKISQLYQANSTKKVANMTSVKTKDRVEISQVGKDYQIAKQAVAQVPDIREDKVNQIKQAMISGTYNVGAKEVADKLVENYFNQSV